MGRDEFALLFSGISILFAGISIGWNIFRDCIDKPKLKVRVFVAEIVTPTLQKLPNVISLSVTNIGKKPITLKGHGFRMKDGTQLLFPEVMHLFDNKKLEPYDNLSATFSNEILKTMIGFAPRLRDVYIFDTIGKEWAISKKSRKELVESLNKIAIESEKH